MADLAGNPDQPGLYLARAARLAAGSILGSSAIGKLRLADTGCRDLLCCGLDANLEMALPAQTHKRDPDPRPISDRDHWLHGQQYLSGAHRGSAAGGGF